MLRVKLDDVTKFPQAMKLTEDMIRTTNNDAKKLGLVVGGLPTTGIIPPSIPENLASGTDTIRIDDITDIDDIKISPDPLLIALTDGLKKVLNDASAKPMKQWPYTQTRRYTLTPVLGSALHDNTWHTGVTSVTWSTSILKSTSPQPSSSNFLVSLPTNSDVKLPKHIHEGSSVSTPADILRVLVTELLQKHDDRLSDGSMNPRRPGEDIPAWLLLDGVAGLVAQISPFNSEFAGTLADSLLSLLPIDTEAVERVISEISKDSSVSIEAIIPLVLPAIAKALGRGLQDYPPPSFATKNITNALDYIVAQGTLVLNQIVSSADLGAEINVQNILKQVADGVYAASEYLNRTICAVTRRGGTLQLEVVIPCAYITVDAASMDMITLNPLRSDSISMTTAPWNVVPVASANVGRLLSLQYDQSSQISQSCQTSESTVAGSTASVQVTDQNISRTGGYVPASAAPTSPPETTSNIDPPSRLHCSAARPANGSCQGEGYTCKECLNGWFCPPQETPAQVVPCGLGWPCYHCTSGYFCASTQSSPAASSASCALSSEPSSSCETTDGDSKTVRASSQLEDVLAPVAGWRYLGCFQDAISRTLIGSKPMDYLRGPMSNLTCINHCFSKGYGFAGTENGHECWCGSRIRDDAVRLPEVSCNVPCDGADNQSCGGGWIVAVFILSADYSHTTAATGAMLVNQIPAKTWLSAPPSMATIDITAAASATFAYQSIETKGPIGRLLAGGQPQQTELTGRRIGR